jgi:Kef-type K+ transport system membrane component KefB
MELLLLMLLVLLIPVRLFSEIAERLNQPGLVREPAA